MGVFFGEFNLLLKNSWVLVIDTKIYEYLQNVIVVLANSSGTWGECFFELPASSLREEFG